MSIVTVAEFKKYAKKADDDVAGHEGNAVFFGAKR